MAAERSLEEQVSEMLRSTEANPMLGDYPTRKLETGDAVLIRLAREIDKVKRAT
jgi:hypothetical protein